MFGRIIRLHSRSRVYYSDSTLSADFWRDFNLESSKALFLSRLSHQKEPTWPARSKNPKDKKISECLSTKPSEFAVLVPLCCVNDIPCVLFTTRSSNLSKHRGEISFPGGKVDQSDANHVDTALRETEEEIGFLRFRTDIWGSLPALPARQGGILTAIVGNLGHVTEFDFSLNPGEVEEVFAVSVRTLCSVENIGRTVFRFEKKTFSMPIFMPEGRFGRRKIWGMTAMLLDHVMRFLIPEKYPNRRIR